MADATLLMLAALAHVDPRTADRWRRGKRVMPACAAQLSQAAEKLTTPKDAKTEGPTSAIASNTPSGGAFDVNSTFPRQ